MKFIHCCSIHSDHSSPQSARECDELRAAAGASEPEFKHDCKNCKFLGRYRAVIGPAFREYGGKFDLYVCPQGSAPTVIARFGNKAPDYMSGLPIALAQIGEERNPTWPLVEALTRAIHRGYLKIVWTGKED